MNKLQQRIEALEGNIKPQPSAFLQEALRLQTDEGLNAGKEFCDLCLAGRTDAITPPQLAAYLRHKRTQADLMAAQGMSTAESDTDSVTIETPRYYVKLSLDRQDAGRVIIQKTEKRTVAGTFPSEPV